MIEKHYKGNPNLKAENVMDLIKKLLNHFDPDKLHSRLVFPTPAQIYGGN